jgi:hypothetical protein
MAESLPGPSSPGLVAARRPPDPIRRALGLAVTCVIGIAGHSGGWAPASLFHMAASETGQPSWQLALGFWAELRRLYPPKITRA